MIEQPQVNRRLNALRRAECLSLAFAVSYAQSPLYSSSQVLYFLHGLANGGLGFLSQDWMANTTDPYPVFSLLITLTYRYLQPFVFYLYYFVLLAVYFYSVVGIASKTFGMDRTSREWFAYCVIIAGLHAPAFGYLSSHAVGVNLSRLLHDGLGYQYVLGPALRPASFGVFLILSLYLFLSDRPLWAVCCASLAALFDPTYWLSTATLTVSYMTVWNREERQTSKALFLGLLGCCLVLPVVLHGYICFGATSPAALQEAQRILVDFRIPHKTKPAEWFDYRSLIQILIVVIAVAGCRKKRIGPLLLIPLLASAVLTLGCAITENKSLALLFPWQMSAFLVPVSTCLVVGGAVTTVRRKFSRQFAPYSLAIDVLLAVSLLLLVAAGLLGVRHKWAQALRREDAALLEFVAHARKAGDLYLIPTEFDGFRLYTGSPVFVDERDFPFKDVEVIQWYNRLNLAKKFYAAGGNAACDMLEEIRSQYGVTHVVVRGDLPGLRDLRGPQWCDSMLIFTDDHFRVYELANHE